MNISQAEQTEICNNVLLKYLRYSTRLRGFFNFIRINGSSMEEQCCKFVKKASKIDEDVNAPARSNKNGRGYDGHIR